MSGKSKKILIIEDESLIAMYLKMKFSRKGYDVCETAAGRDDAIRIFEDENPDIVLSDIMLSEGENGIDVVSELRQKAPELPVIFLTGYEDDSIKKDAAPLNPLGYYIKPIDIDEVSIVIDDFFDQAI